MTNACLELQKGHPFFKGEQSVNTWGYQFSSGCEGLWIKK